MPSCSGVEPPYPSASLCPIPDDSIIGSPQNNPYRIRCGYDTSGNAYGPVQETCRSCTYVDCMAACDASAACAGFTLTGAEDNTNGQGLGFCYLKQQAAQGAAVSFQPGSGVSPTKVAVLKACPGSTATGTGGPAPGNTQYTTVTYGYQPTASETTIRTSTTIQPSGTNPGTVRLHLNQRSEECIANRTTGRPSNPDSDCSLYPGRLPVALQPTESRQPPERKFLTYRQRPIQQQSHQFFGLQPHRRLSVRKLSRRRQPRRSRPTAFPLHRIQRQHSVRLQPTHLTLLLHRRNRFQRTALVRFPGPLLPMDSSQPQPNLPAYQQIVDNGTTTNPAGNRVQDWAFVLGGGPYLYGVAIANDGATTLNRFDLTTKTWSAVGPLGPNGYTITDYAGEKRWNALYSGVGNDDLFGLEGFSGQLWRINVNTLTAEFVIQGPVGSSEADGARCLNATTL